jgi:hypothetical protein
VVVLEGVSAMQAECPALPQNTLGGHGMQAPTYSPLLNLPLKPCPQPG